MRKKRSKDELMSYCREKSDELFGKYLAMLTQMQNDPKAATEAFQKRAMTIFRRSNAFFITSVQLRAC